MDIAELLSRVAPQRFKSIDLGNARVGIIPICSNPRCNKPLRKFSEGLWASLEDEQGTIFELRSFCRNGFCDIFKEIEQETHYSLMSAWWELNQLWCLDQRSRWEKRA